MIGMERHFQGEDYRLGRDAQVSADGGRCQICDLNLDDHPHLPPWVTGLIGIAEEATPISTLSSNVQRFALLLTHPHRQCMLLF